VSLVDRVRNLLPPKYRELAKFLVVGGTAWIVDTALFTLLTHTILTEKVLTCKVISMLVATVLSYILNREWSFDGRGGRQMPHEALLFFVFNGIGLAVNLAPLATSHYLLGIDGKIADWISANIVGTLLGTMFRYWAYRRWVFPEELNQPTTTARPAEPSR
jgi:putative flippase GtrA